MLANYRPLILADAILDMQTRRINIQCSETRFTFNSVKPWKGLYEVPRELNEELARINAGIVVWKIVPKENGKAKPVDRLFPEAVPKLRNGKALAHVSLVGYKTAWNNCG